MAAGINEPRDATSEHHLLAAETRSGNLKFFKHNDALVSIRLRQDRLDATAIARENAVTSSDVVILVVRYGLVILFFPASALDKIINFKGAVGQAREVFPGALGTLMILAGLFIELVMPLGILTGVADRLAALIMAGYCASTAVLFKRFWQPGDFFHKGQSKGRDLFWDFLKNFSLASGFLLITVGLNGHGLADFFAHPFGSSHPYGG